MDERSHKYTIKWRRFFWILKIDYKYQKNKNIYQKKNLQKNNKNYKNLSIFLITLKSISQIMLQNILKVVPEKNILEIRRV